MSALKALGWYLVLFLVYVACWIGNSWYSLGRLIRVIRAEL